MSVRPPTRQRPAPPLTDKAKRALWGIVWLLAFRSTPTPLHGWRRSVLRLFGARVERGVRVYPSVRVWAPWNLVLDANCVVGGDAELYAVDTISIGAGTVISQKAYLCTASHDASSPNFELVSAPIDIAANAWVAAAAYVGPGVRVGEGAVVAACAVAVKNVEPRAIVAGNPARIIGTRNERARNRLR